MRIQEVSKQCGLSKKTIYYYINEGLVSPLREENNYLNFTTEDIEQLVLIKKLRHLDLSIADIKDLLLHPAHVNFFLHKRAFELKSEMITISNKLSSLYYVLDHLSPSAIPHELLVPSLFQEPDKLNENSRQQIEMLFPDRNSRMVAILFWGPFLTVPANEYRLYLWKKISNKLDNIASTHFTHLCTLMYQLSSDTIKHCCTLQYKKITSILANGTDIASISANIIQACTDLCEDIQLQQYWITMYEHILCPIFSFYNSEANELMKEYTSEYNEYHSLMHQAVQLAYQQLEEDIRLRETMKYCLQGNIHFTISYEQELITILTFKENLLTQIPLEMIKNILG